MENARCNVTARPESEQATTVAAGIVYLLVPEARLRSTFYKAVGAGDLRVRKYGKRTFVTTEELKRFVENMRSG